MKIRVLSVFLFLGVFSVFFFSCETTAPEILSIQWQINIIERLDSGGYEENLTFHVSASDEDGNEDLTSLYLMHDSSEQYWSLSSENWISNSVDGEFWIGSSDITMPDGSPIPRGDYRVVLYDAAGEKVEKEFKIDTVVIDPKKVTFPKITGKDDIIYLESPLTNVNALIYDRNRRFVDSAIVEFDKTPLTQFPRYRDLTEQSRNQLFLYVWEREKGYGIVSGPIVGLYDEAKKTDSE